MIFYNLQNLHSQLLETTNYTKDEFDKGCKKLAKIHFKHNQM